MANVTRRQVLVGAGAGAAMLVPGLGHAAADIPVLEARLGRMQLVPGDGPETEIWGYGGDVPGPMIRVPQGARIQRRLFNNLPQPTAVHWHGLRINNAMDGVPGLTQDAVEPGAGFDYDFVARDAGTFWYHSHNQSTEQVARGLYGLLIVDEPDQPDLDHDIAVVVDDWRLTQDAAITEDFNQTHDWSHAGRLGNYIQVRQFPDLAGVKQYQRLRLRFVNTATDRIMQIGLQGLDGHVVAYDGMPLRVPEPAGPFILAPAQRVDMIVDVTAAEGEPARLLFVDRGETYILSEWAVTGQQSLTRRGKVQALAANPIAVLGDVTATRQVPLVMTGGAMGGLQQAIYKGVEMNTETLIENGQIWAFNGVAGMPEQPLAVVGLGETIRIPITNDTVFPHAMHIHGTHFQEVLQGGGLGPHRDTILLAPNETREIALLADNPGEWLFHCHMLSHQAAGMRTWIRVEA
ncbi:MAG TPA: multicopper oxidase family protein [Aliiroseovarius sp.]|nr:multicopper oxidase family protein [Aliiroseovarius sp.]